MKKILCLLLSIILAFTTFSGCGYNSSFEEKPDNITYYTVKDVHFLNEKFIYNYNKSCEKEEDKIEIIEFENEDALKNKLTTELMSGGGPDIMTENLFLSANLSLEKLISADAFLDLNALVDEDKSENKINWSDYNQKALQSGVLGGKRFCVPLYFIPNFLITSEEKYSKYIGGKNPSLSFDEAINLCERLLENENDVTITPYMPFFEMEGLLLDYIDYNVDLINKTFNFDSSGFKSAVSEIRRLKSQLGQDGGGTDEVIIGGEGYEAPKPDSYIFENQCSESPYFLYSNMVYMEQRGEVPTLVGSPIGDSGVLSAQIASSIFVNKNTDKKDKVLKLIKYALSEESQNEIVGVNIKTYDPAFENCSGYFFPINNKSLEKLMNTAESFEYNATESYYNGDDDGVPGSDAEQAEVSNGSKKLLRNALNNISEFKLNVYYYYNTSVIGELISSYLKGDVSEERFLSELEAKTRIYIEE